MNLSSCSCCLCLSPCPPLHLCPFPQVCLYPYPFQRPPEPRRGGRGHLELATLQLILYLQLPYSARAKRHWCWHLFVPQHGPSLPQCVTPSEASSACAHRSDAQRWPRPASSALRSCELPSLQQASPSPDGASLAFHALPSLSPAQFFSRPQPRAVLQEPSPAPPGQRRGQPWPPAVPSWHLPRPLLQS